MLNAKEIREATDKAIKESEDFYKKLSDEELRQVNAKEVKAWDVPRDAKFVGRVMYPYGDMNYYRLPDGSYICNYFSIGD